MDHELRLEQTQKLIMTPELRQAITVLQLSSLELAEMVEREVTENPVLEIQEEAGEEEDWAPERPEDDLDRYFAWEEYFNDGTDLGYSGSGEREEKQYDYFWTSHVTLQEHLLFQLHLTVLNDAQRAIGEYIIGCINDNGYLTVDVAEIARTLAVPTAEVEAALAVIQTFDPAGVGARCLVECLLLQVANRQESNPLVPLIIERHLKELAEGKIQKIADALKVSPHAVQEAADIIRRLDPKPGRQFGGVGDTRYIVPDAVIERVDNRYMVLINDSCLPRLSINSYYRRVARDGDEQVKRYIEGRLNAAVWLIKSIEQRRSTLYKVISAIVDLQQDFLARGRRYLRPLTLKQVADMIGVHESTVSRATHNKYVQTPQGIFPLRLFFSHAVRAREGVVAATSIKQTLKSMIEQEDPRNPLSDQAIAAAFAARGVRLSRRTVAKYRDELGIPASNKRKRY